MYFVRTAWELISLERRKRDWASGEDTRGDLRVFVISLEGFEMMATGADSEVVHGRGLSDSGNGAAARGVRFGRPHTLSHLSVGRLSSTVRIVFSLI